MPISIVTFPPLVVIIVVFAFRAAALAVVARVCGHGGQRPLMSTGDCKCYRGKPLLTPTSTMTTFQRCPESQVSTYNLQMQRNECVSDQIYKCLSVILIHRIEPCMIVFTGKLLQKGICQSALFVHPLVQSLAAPRPDTAHESHFRQQSLQTPAGTGRRGFHRT